MTHRPTRGRASPIVVQLAFDGLKIFPSAELKEAELLTSISSLLPPDVRGNVRTLAQGGGDFSDPAFEKAEIQMLVEELTLLYDSALQAEIAAQHAGNKEQAGNRVHVIVALVPREHLKGSKVALLRGPENDGLPVVLLDEVAATDVDARIGVAAAVAAVRVHPAAPSSQTFQSIDPSAFEQHMSAGEVVEELRREVDPLELPGVGTVRWTMIASS